MGLTLNEKLEIRSYDNATVCGISGIFDAAGCFIPYTSMRKYGKKEWTVPSKMEYPPMKYVDDEVLYLGRLRQHYGHFIVDSVGRFWVLTRPEFQNMPIVVSAPGGWLPEFFWEFFAMSGIPRNRVMLLNDETIRYRKIYIPQLSYIMGEYISNEFKQPFETVIEFVKQNNKYPVYQKIYLKKYTAHDKRIKGEEKIITSFERNGFAILNPAELSFKEQIWYYNHCDIMVSTNGTLAHNIIWAKDGTGLLILERFPGGRNNEHQNYINLIKQAKVDYVPIYDMYSDYGRSFCKFTPELQKIFLKYNWHWEKDDLKINYLKYSIYRIRKTLSKLKKIWRKD